MHIQPRIRGFICTSAHPKGCEKAVLEQIAFVKSQEPIAGAKNVLVIGASTGYGLASRIVSAFGCKAKTLGVFWEKAADEKRTASPGWYNTAALEKAAQNEGLYAQSMNGDAFSQEMKEQVIAKIRQDLGTLDLVIYSLASPKRVDPVSGQVYTSSLKPIGQTFKSKTIDAFKGEVKDVSIEPATHDEIAQTIAVMGGEDWKLWMTALMEANVLSLGVKTIAYSYIGPNLTHPIYKDGTIGQAKLHLKKTAAELNQLLTPLHGEAIIPVAKAVVTQASAAIPVVPLYLSLLFKIMKEVGTHEGCIEQIYRLFHDYLYADNLSRDAEGFIRLDHFELDEKIQNKIHHLWPTITTENVEQLTDIAGYRNDFYKLFGFNLLGVDYTEEVDPEVPIPSLLNE